LALWVARDVQRWQAWRSHSVEVLLQVQAVREAVLDADQAQRVYTLTGVDTQLPAYHQAVERAREALNTLFPMVSDNAAQTETAKELGQLVDLTFGDLEAGIGLRRAGAVGALTNPARESVGISLMDQLRGLAKVMEERELELRSKRAAAETRASRLLIIVIVLGCALSALLNIAIQVSVRNDVIDRKRDADLIEEQGAKLKETHSNLEDRVRALTRANHTIAEHSRAIDSMSVELRYKVTELDRSNRDLAQFAYVVSHDLKAPLRGISSLATWIEEDVGPSLTGDATRHLRLMRDRITRMEAMIEGILSYSRAGWTSAAATKVELGKLLTEIATLVAPPADVELIVKPAPFEVEVVPVQLQQVVQNLLSNAIKHGTKSGAHAQNGANGNGNGAPGATIVVDAADLGERFRVTVKDDGPGIDPRYHGRIFGLFQTLRPKESGESTGIGLAVVKKLVEQHGGSVVVESSPGEGARFSFTWPKRPRIGALDTPQGGITDPLSSSPSSQTSAQTSA
jgi:signal transduction histidine kinase